MSDPTSELLQKWVHIIKQGDPKQVTNLYHENGILLGTFSAKERIGHELILEYFENLLQNPVDVEIISEHVHISESIAVNSGLYNFITNGKTINARFSFVYIWDDSEWKIISHHSSVLPEN
jgi:uncharacterized protein (TIGR02246 family)